jgi:hypothetical protein
VTKQPNRGYGFDCLNSWTCYLPRVFSLVAATSVANLLQPNDLSSEVSAIDCHDAVRVLVHVEAVVMDSGDDHHNRPSF